MSGESKRRYRTIVADPPWPYKDGPTARQRARGDESFLPYGTMSLPEITRLLRGLDVAVDAHLYLWTTQRFLWGARDVAQRAGYKVDQVCVWAKRPNGPGMGHAFAPTVEFFLFCRRNWGTALNDARLDAGLTINDVSRRIRDGRNTGLASMWMSGDRYPNEDDWARLEGLFGPFGPRAGLANPVDSSWWEWPRGEHSAKPDAFYDLVEQASPGPYLELFARRARLGDWHYWGDQSLNTAEVAA